MGEGLNWPVFGGQVGLGALLGFAVGYTTKKTLKILMVVVALLLGAALLFEHQGFITVHWARLEDAYVRAIEDAGGLRALFEGWAASLGAMIPVTGSFVLGFLWGLRRG